MPRFGVTGCECSLHFLSSVLESHFESELRSTRERRIIWVMGAPDGSVYFSKKSTRLRIVFALLTDHVDSRPEMCCATGGMLSMSGGSLIWLCICLISRPFRVALCALCGHFCRRGRLARAMSLVITLPSLAPLELYPRFFGGKIYLELV